MEVEQTRAEDARGIQYEYNTEVRPMQSRWQQTPQSHAIHACSRAPSLRHDGLPGAGQPGQERGTGNCVWLQEAEQRQAAEEAAKSGDDANDLEKAQDFGRLRTMKVQQAVVTGQRSKAARLTSQCLQTVPCQHEVSGLQLLGHHSPGDPPEERLGDKMPPDAPLRTLQQ